MHKQKNIKIYRFIELMSISAFCRIYLTKLAVDSMYVWAFFLSLIDAVNFQFVRLSLFFIYFSTTFIVFLLLCFLREKSILYLPGMKR